MRRVVLALLAPFCLVAADGAAARAVEDAHLLRWYRAGKNSFVESTDRHAGAWTGMGYRFTLLELKGPGSLRHIWSTWLPDGPYFEWQFFVDGEAEPSIRGTLPQIVEAAAKLQACPAPACSVAMDPAKRDFNLYAPVPFDRSLRVDVVQQTGRVGLFFCQLDYRTEDESLRGVRLRQGAEGLRYEGWRPQSRPEPATSPVSFPAREIRPGERVAVASAEGPGIVRGLEIDAPMTSSAWLRVRYDGAREDAIAGPLSRVFGDFQGASFSRVGARRAVLHLPMPFRSRVDVFVENRGSEAITASAGMQVEGAARFSPDWGYLHGYYRQDPRTNGHRLHQVLYTRGRGHWLGMSLFNTGHDHGGGDFAVIDGETPSPAFLHGVNGEDYFTFAWFGKGQHQPYAQAFTNEQGRYRHHLENPYPFRKSFHMEWGAYPNLQPESFTVWYQDSPESAVVEPDDRGLLGSWDVIGPVPIPLEVSRAKKGVFSVLPSVEALDAGKRFPLSNEGEPFEAGWLQDYAHGPSLNLTYISRHGVKVQGEKNLGGNGHAFLARQRYLSPRAETLTAYLSHDDPIEVEWNGTVVYRELDAFPHFETRKLALPAAAGVNRMVVRLTNYFNRTFNWTGFGLYVEDAQGAPVGLR
jgi:hypothetical protein